MARCLPRQYRDLPRGPRRHDHRARRPGPLLVGGGGGDEGEGLALRRKRDEQDSGAYLCSLLDGRHPFLRTVRRPFLEEGPSRGRSPLLRRLEARGTLLHRAGRDIFRRRRPTRRRGAEAPRRILAHRRSGPRRRRGPSRDEKIHRGLGKVSRQLHQNSGDHLPPRRRRRLRGEKKEKGSSISSRRAITRSSI